jgi:hypothetical protein
VKRPTLYARWADDGNLLALIATAPVVEEEPQAPPPAERTPLDDTDLPDPEGGVRWRMPIFVLEGWETSDGRLIEAGSLGRRDLPQSLMAMVRNPDGGWGHDAALVAGRIDRMERYDASAVINRETGQPFGDGVWAWSAEGWLIPNADQPGSQATLDYVRSKSLRGVSVDMGEVEADIEVLEEDEDGFPEKVRMRITQGSIGQATICPFAAFPGAYIELAEEEPLTDEELPPVESARALTLIASSPVPQEPTGISPVAPPRAWFERVEQLNPSRHVYVGRRPDGTPTGQVWGYIAEWGVPHSGVQDRYVEAPRLGDAGYRTFLSQGAVMTEEGEELSCGLLTFGGGHLMNMNAGVAPALAHYDNAGTAYVKCRAGEDDFGVWFAGAFSPMLTRAQIEDFASHPLSGDWRANPGDRNVRLVAALSVNTPGFNIGAKAHIAASGARALVAAGSAPLARRARHGGTDAAAVEAAINRALRPVLASAARSSLQRLTRPRS